MVLVGQVGLGFPTLKETNNETRIYFLCGKRYLLCSKMLKNKDKKERKVIQGALKRNEKPKPSTVPAMF